MVDKLMRRHGYRLLVENKYGAEYQKEEDGGIHRIDIKHKASGNHIMQSYDGVTRKTEDGDWISCQWGVPIPVLLLCWLKAQKLKFKYHW